jgi:spore maturation protein CgeB/thioredoxin-like negative regulator of GroEL
MVTPRILTFNFHEPYLCLMAKMGYPIDIGNYNDPPHAREWQTQFRPVPDNLTFVDESQWRADLAAEKYDVVIAQNEMNAIDLLPCNVPSLLLCHNRRTFLESTMEDQEKGRALYAEALEKLALLYEFVFISESKRADYGLPGRIILPGIDVEDYGGYTGEVAEVLRVGNVMRARNLMFDVDFQETVCRDLPNKLLGEDAEIPYAAPSKSFEDLVDHYRTRRCMLHVTCSQYEDGYNLAMLEAMASGMPVVALSNPSSPITDGVDGYIAPDAGTLRNRLEMLLEEPDLASAIGERGRDTVARTFPIAAFIENWREAIEEAASRSTRYVERQAAEKSNTAQSPSGPPRLNILLDYISAPCMTGRYFDIALRKRHEITTTGTRLPEEILEGWGFDPPFPAYAPQQIPTPSDGVRPTLLPMLPESYSPEMYLWIDSGFSLIPEDLEKIPKPRVAYFIDTHINISARLEMATQFDYVFLAQQAQVEKFILEGIKNVAWLPLACSPELHDVDDQPRTIDVSYVGSLTENTDARRLKLMGRVAEQFPNNAIGMRWPEDMAQVYAKSKIVVNACINHDVNMRVFEALASGALLITDDAEGLEELFVDGQHLVMYHKDDDLFDLVEYFLKHDEERERIAAAGKALVYKRHTYDQRTSQLVRMVLDDMGKLGGMSGESRFHKGGYYMAPRPEVAAHVPKFSQRVLDCGCGAGEFGRSLKERGVQEVVGIEIVERACEIAKENLDQALHGSIENMDLPFEDRYFDCVVFADVLEHLVEPVDALRKVSRCLTEDGLIVISIPNIRFWQQVQMHAEGRWKYEDAGIMDRTHLRFFCKSDLERLIEDAGLELVKLEPLSTWPAEGLPRNEQGCLQLGNVTIGPLDDEEYKEFLVYQYMVVAGRPGVDRLNPARRAQAEGQHQLAYTLANEAGKTDENERTRLMAKSLAMMGKLDTAEALYRNVLRATPDDKATQGDLGMVLIAQQQIGDARPFIEAAHASDPKNARYTGGLGLIALTEGDTHQALDRFIESLQIENDNEDLLRHAIALAREMDRLPDIDDLLRSFCEFRPGHVEMNIEFAERLINSGDNTKASERLEMVLMLESENQRATELLTTARSNAHEKSA